MSVRPRFHTTRPVPGLQLSDYTKDEISGETEKAHCRLEALALLSEAAASLDPRPGVMLNSADALAVALRYKGQKALLRSFYQKEQIRAREKLVSSWRQNDAKLHQVESEHQDTQQQLSEIRAAIAKQERANILLANSLRERRHFLNVTKFSHETATIKNLHRNEAWLRQKLQKNALHSRLWTVRDQTATLQRRVDRERADTQAAVGKGTQQLARLQTHISDAETKLAGLKTEIDRERSQFLDICAASTRHTELDRFGIFANAKGLTPGLSEISVDIESIHAMDSEARNFAMLHLADRFSQLQDVSKHLRRLVSEATSCYDTLDLSDTLECIQQKATDLVESTEARCMLVDDHETYFWYPKEDASGDEDNETFVRVPAGSGITGYVLRTRELMAVDGPAQDERYDPTIDAVMGNTPQALLVCPIFHPENPSQPIGVLQCFNKRSRVGSFSQLDEFTIRLLTRYVAAAAVNADRFNIEYRLDLYARRVMDLTENIANEKELSELPGHIVTRSKELLNAHRARLYFVAPGDGPIERRLVQSPFVVRFMFGRDPLHACGTGGMVPILMTTFGKSGPSAEACLQNLADVACCTDFVNCGLWLGITKQLLSCSFVGGHRVVFRHYYKGFFPTKKNGKALLTTSKRSHAMDAQPLLPSALERHVAASGSVVVSAAADKACGYDPEFDLESNFEAIHVAAAPLISDINEVMGVLTVLRGWSKDTRPQEQVVWSDAQYAPFSPNEEFAIGAFAQVCATALQAGMLHERLRQPPPITKHITSSLTRQAALELCAEQASAICRVQAVRIVFPAGKGTWAWSPTLGLHRPPLGGLIAQVASTCVPVRVGPEELCPDAANVPQAQHSGTLTPEGSGVFRPKQAAGSGKYDPASDAIEGIDAQHVQFVPILDPSALARGQKDSRAKTTAVLQLVNKCNGAAFSFVDEYLLLTLTKHVAYAFEMAWANEQAWSAQAAAEILTDAVVDIHQHVAEVRGSEKQDPAFNSWILDVVGKFAVSDEKTQSTRGDDAIMSEQYVAIIDAGGSTLGVIELVANGSRQKLLGPSGYSAQELAAVAEFGKHVGSFLDIDAQKIQTGSA